MGESITTEAEQNDRERLALAEAVASARADSRPAVPREQVRTLLRADAQAARERLTALGRR